MKKIKTQINNLKFKGVEFNPFMKTTATLFQPICFTKEQYKDLLRAVSMYAFVKGFGAMPDLGSVELGAHIMEQGEKFGYTKEKMGEMEWFSEINDEVFQSLYEYTEEEVWHNLAMSLAKRDMQREQRAQNVSLDKADTDAFLDRLGKKMKWYLKEFEQNGTHNLELRKNM